MDELLIYPDSKDQPPMCQHTGITYLVLSKIPPIVFPEMLYSLEWELKTYAN